MFTSQHFCGIELTVSRKYGRKVEYTGYLVLHHQSRNLPGIGDIQIPAGTTGLKMLRGRR